MSTLETLEVKNTRKGMIAFTIFTLVFAVIYECFSHGVYSKAMIFAYMIPLTGSVLPATFLLLANRRSPVSVWLWNCGVLALTVGALFQGVLEIYGTTNSQMVVYWILGGVTLVAALIFGHFHEPDKMAADGSVDESF